VIVKIINVSVQHSVNKNSSLRGLMINASSSIYFADPTRMIRVAVNIEDWTMTMCRTRRGLPGEC